MLKTWTNILLTIAMAMVLLSCSTEKKPEMYTVGIINLNANLDRAVAEFKRGMSHYGYHEGETITYIYHGALANPQQIDQELTQLLQADLDLLVTLTTPVTKKAQQRTKDSNLPILFAPTFSPVSTGIVQSLAHPGGNITGIKVRGSTGKALEWFLKVSPSAKRVLVPFHYTDKTAMLSVADLKEAALFFDIELIIQKVTNWEELNTSLNSMETDIDAVWLTHSHLLISHVKEIVAAATLRNKPTISATDQSSAGVMLCYAMSQETIGRQASRLADKILRGISPGTIPVESADYFLGLNLKTAQMVGIKIPDEIISQAKFISR